MSRPEFLDIHFLPPPPPLVPFAAYCHQAVASCQFIAAQIS